MKFTDLRDGDELLDEPDKSEQPAGSSGFTDLQPGDEVVSEPLSAYSDLQPGDEVVDETATPTPPSTGWFKRNARVAGAGLFNFAANIAGSSLLSGSKSIPQLVRDARDKGETPTVLEAISQPVFGGLYKPEQAAKVRETIKSWTPEAWSKTFEEETKKEMPSPMKDPLGFLSAAITQSAADLGNVGTAALGSSPAGIAAAALVMADQEGGGFVENWSKGAGLPLDFVAPYARAYGLLSAPIEYAQSAAFAGNKSAGKLLAKVPGGKQIIGAAGKAAAKVATSRAGRALLKAMDISVEGLEEVTQGWIEQKVAERMAKAWNKEHPDQAITIPAFTSDQAWENFKAGAGMGLIFEGVRGAKAGAVRIVTDQAANTRSKAAANRVAQKIPLDAAAEERSAAAAARTAAEKTKAPGGTEGTQGTQGTEGTPPPPKTDLGAGVKLPTEDQAAGSTVPGYVPTSGKTRGRTGTKATPVQKAYDRDTPMGDFPLMDLVVRQNGIRKPANMSENYGGPEGRDVVQLLYNPEGSVTPDEAARMAKDAGLLAEGHEDEFWDRLAEEVDQYRRMRAAGHKSLAGYGEAQREEHEADQQRLIFQQAERWANGTKQADGRTPVPASELRAGDALIVAGRRVEVNGVDEESGNVVLSDAGTGGFGTQTVRLDEVIHADRVLQDGIDEDAGAREARFAADVAVGIRPVSVPVAELAVGDRLQVGPSVLTVRGVDPDSGTVELDDLGGMRIYGRQSVPAGGTLTVDAFTKAEAPADEALPFLKRTTTAGTGAGGTRETGGAPPPTPVGARIDRIAGDREAADDFLYSRLPLRLHHLVSLAKQLGATVRLSKARGNWLGRFKAVDAGPAGVTKEILLRHNLFQLVPEARQAELRAEAKAEAEQKFGGNDPAAAAAIEEQLFQEKVQREKIAALEKGTPEAVAVMAHEVGHLVDYAPDNTLKRGNLLGHMAALKGYMKSMLQERANAGNLIPPAVRRILDRDARQSAGKRPKEEGPEIKAWAERRRRAYQIGMRREAARRGLITLEQIDEESQGLIAWWNGTAEMPDYFKSAAERYAEVFSVLMNNPAAVAKRAPTFWRAWNAFLKARPEAARVYDQMQDDISTGADLDKARAEQRAEIEKTAARDLEEFEREQKNRTRTLWDKLTYYAFRAQGPIDWQIVKAEQKAMREAGIGRLRRWTAAGSSAIAQAAEAAGTGTLRAALGNFRYATTFAELYQHDMRNQVLEPMWAQGVSETDFAEYMADRHIAENRPDIASTGGIDPAEALRRLRNIEATNPAGYAAMKAGAERWFAVRAKHVIAALEREGMLNDEMKKTLREREAYVTFLAVFDQVGENDPFGLVAEMAARFGPGVTAHIGFQRGWLGGIKDPIAATMQKDRKIIRATQRNAAARELGKFLLAQQAADPTGRPLIAPAEQEWHGGKNGKMGTRMLGESSPHLGDLIWIENGEAKHYYIPRAYSEFLNGMHPNDLLRLWTAFNAYTIMPIKRALVDWSAGAWPWLAGKDFRAYMQQTPGVNPIKKLAGFRTSFRASRSISAGTPDDLARQAMDRGMVMSRAQRSEFDAGESAQQREVNIFGIMRRSEEQTQNERFHAIRELGRKYADFADKFNKTMAGTWKIQAMQLLDKHAPNMPEWQKAELVREVAGNPDFLHRAAAASIIDWSQLYYNAAKEGRMAALKAFRNHPADYVANSLIWTAGPSILMGALGLGLVSKALGHLLRPEEKEDVEELEQMMKWIPSYEKQRNQIIPLAWADRTNKRVIYLRIPVSEGEMPAHAFVQAMMNGEINAGSTVNAMFLASGAGDMNPGNPIWNVLAAWKDYYLSRRNPYDSYRGSMMMSDTEYQAGGRYAAARLSKFTWDTFVGSLLGRLPYSQSPYAPDKTMTEKALQFPVVAPIIGKWVRVSSGFDEEAKLLTDKMNTKDARARLDVQRMVKGFVDKGQAPTPEQMARLMGDPKTAGYTERYAKELNLRRSMPPDVRSIMDHMKNGVPDEVAQELLKRRGFTR